MSRFIHTIDDFSDQASDLREHFEKQFEEPLEAHEKRFQWDYWHVPDQYTLVRTPAYHYFPEELYESWQQELLEWGQQNLGCQGISPPWLSYYVDGCEQRLHADVPHGPWAYVFSLTPWEDRAFDGGETLLLKPSTLQYWHNFDWDRGREREDLEVRVEPVFNRLTVFDPRIPHAVERVTGTKDPRQARLVIHGWFTEPQPTILGTLDIEESQEELNAAIQDCHDLFSEYPDSQGLITLKLEVKTNGQLEKVEAMTNTVVGAQLTDEEALQLQKSLVERLETLEFSKTEEDSEIILPLFFT